MPIINRAKKSHVARNENLNAPQLSIDYMHFLYENFIHNCVEKLYKQFMNKWEVNSDNIRILWFSRVGHPRTSFSLFAHRDLQSHPCSLMQRHQVLPKGVRVRRKVSKKTGYSDFSFSEAINSLDFSRDVHPLPLIPTFILCKSFHDIRTVGSTTAPKVMTPEPSEKSCRYSRRVKETVETRQVEIQVSSGAQKWKGIWYHLIKAG